MITALGIIVCWLLVRRHVKRLRVMAEELRTIRNKV